MSALEGDRDTVMKTLGDTIRGLEPLDQLRIIATTLNALEKGGQGVWLTNDGIETADAAAHWMPSGRQWHFTDWT